MAPELAKLSPGAGAAATLTLNRSAAATKRTRIRPRLSTCSSTPRARHHAGAAAAYTSLRLEFPSGKPILVELLRTCSHESALVSQKVRRVNIQLSRVRSFSGKSATNGRGGATNSSAQRGAAEHRFRPSGSEAVTSRHLGRRFDRTFPKMVLRTA